MKQIKKKKCLVIEKCYSRRIIGKATRDIEHEIGRKIADKTNLYWLKEF